MRHSRTAIRRLSAVGALAAAVAIAAVATPGTAAAQDASTAPAVLRLPASTRALGMGDVLVAGRGSDVLFYNPAQLALSRGITLSAARYGSASTLGALSVADTVWGWGVGAGVQLLDTWAPEDRVGIGASGLAVRGAVRASSRAVTLGVSRELRGVRLGVAAKYADERVPSDQDGVLAVDLGAAREFGPLTVGLAAQNLGPDLRSGATRAEQPQRATLGAMVVAPPIGAYVDLAVTTALSVSRDGFVAPAGGAELSVSPWDGLTLSARAGARRIEHPAIRPFTFGGGVSIDRLLLDYAYEDIRGAHGAHRIGVQIR